MRKKMARFLRNCIDIDYFLNEISYIKVGLGMSFFTKKRKKIQNQDNMHIYKSTAILLIQICSVLSLFTSNERKIIIFSPLSDENEIAMKKFQMHAMSGDLYSSFVHSGDENSKESDTDFIVPSLKWFSFEENDKTILGVSIDISMLQLMLNVHDDDPKYFMDSYEIESIGDDEILRTAEELKYRKMFRQKEKFEKKVQHDAPWGLSRTSQRETFDSRDYSYLKNDGSNVDVYVVDTGIFVEHPDFQGRAKWGTSFVKSRMGGDYVYKDDNGHGTHCAGTVGGTNYGVCKNCNLIAVKVLAGDGSGSLSDVIAGIEWVVKQSLETKRPSVISMSLGGSFSSVMNRAANAAVNKGVHFVTAAGNSREDACGFSPASADKVISVGASTVSDSIAVFSNYGPCMTLFAPGHGITSTWNDGNTNTISGTSMATPHVAGAVAALLSRKEYKGLKPAQMKKALLKLSTKKIIADIPAEIETENALLYCGLGEPAISGQRPQRQSKAGISLEPSGFETDIQIALIKQAQ